MSTTTPATEPFVPTARIDNPALLLEGALDGVHALNKAVSRARIPEATLELMALRAGQINGCGVCVTQHPKIMRKRGETDDRIFAVAGWRDAPFYTEAERAALALTECVTRIADGGDSVPEDVWQECAAHFSEEQLAALVLHIGLSNLFNRMNVATAQVAGVGW